MSVLGSRLACRQSAPAGEDALLPYAGPEAALIAKEQQLQQARCELAQWEKELEQLLAQQTNSEEEDASEACELQVMRLQLSVLDHVREIVELRETLRNSRMSMYKSCYYEDSEPHASPNCLANEARPQHKVQHRSQRIPRFGQ
mmetsp:Transcript_39099/g.77461  ORF Transcript_39099/g.77461 Transcript_39099/m.77461 type:complete len:144 (+) Transcript_39099:36-467(+)